MEAVVYRAARRALATGSLDLVGDPLKVALVADSYRPDADRHTSFADVRPHEVRGRDYEPGGKALRNRCLLRGLGGAEVFDADDLEWPSSFRASRAVLYKCRGGPDAADELVCCFALRGRGGESLPFVGKVCWDADGILQL